MTSKTRLSHYAFPFLFAAEAFREGMRAAVERALTDGGIAPFRAAAEKSGTRAARGGVA